VLGHMGLFVWLCLTGTVTLEPNKIHDLLGDGWGEFLEILKKLCIFVV